VLKEKYRNEEEKCSFVVESGAEVLEEIILIHQNLEDK